MARPAYLKQHKISDLIQQLEEIRKEHGDLPVRIFDIRWDTFGLSSSDPFSVQTANNGTDIGSLDADEDELNEGEKFLGIG